MAVLPSVQRVGIMALPSATVPVHITEGTRAFLDSVIASIPADKRGSARLVIDWDQVRGAAVEAQIGAHVAKPVDVAASAGWSQQRGGYVNAMVRIEWD